MPNIKDISKVKADASNSGGASSTPRKFTSWFRQDALPATVSVNLDWLSLLVACAIPEPGEGAERLDITDDITLKYMKSGTPIFKHSYECYMYGELVAKMHTHTRNAKLIKDNFCKLEIMNQMFYGGDWLGVYDALAASLQISHIENISRLDIAIDGCNHIPVFMNCYVKQGKYSKAELGRLGVREPSNKVHMLGKANVDCRRMDKDSMTFNSFKIGCGPKVAVIYNKSKEIDTRSHKEYIRDQWARDGLHKEAEQWRFELRLTGEALKKAKCKDVEITEPDGTTKVVSVEGVDIQRLTDPYYLVKIVNTHIAKWFEFVVMDDDTNVTRARKIDLFHFNKLCVPVFQKVQRAIVDGAYKAKMSIHNCMKNVLNGIIEHPEKVNNALNHMVDNLEIYNLKRWFLKKKDEWVALYAAGGRVPDFVAAITADRTYYQ
jgi:hypothetical protein